MSLSRRAFLTYLGIGSYALLRGDHGLKQPAFPSRRQKGKCPSFFQPIESSTEDQLILPQGFRSTIVCKWEDEFGTDKNGNKLSFGFNNDFLAFFPIDCVDLKTNQLKPGGKSSREGLLWTNHEYPDPVFVSEYTGKGKKTAEQIKREKYSVGGSVLHIQKVKDDWRLQQDSPHVCRFTGDSPPIVFSGPAKDELQETAGTLANCSGGRTPWMTVLTCEENFQDYNPVPDPKKKETFKMKYGWEDVPALKINEEHFGWITEIDPFGKLPPRKLTALGRFSHENAAMRVGPTGKLVVYMGDDARDQYLYKFVSAETLKSSEPRDVQRGVLEKGTLYVADLQNLRWLPLDLDHPKSGPKLKDAGFKSQSRVLIDARLAAKALGATPLDRPEDCEVHPDDGTLYVALTNNTSHGNFFGQILRLLEDADNPEGESFRFEIYLAGGPQSGLACPDNLLFDRRGNLWIVCDINSASQNKGPYKSFGNNGVYVVPTKGPSAGDAFQFASGPIDCEITGPWFTENEDTLFLSIQHPGEECMSLDKTTSHWPEGGKAKPRPAVVAISGFNW